MKKILLTGGSGFIGQHLLARIGSKFEIYNLKNDLRHHELVDQEVREFAPDLIVHLAARTEVESSFYEQITFADVNYTGTVNLIESALRCKHTPGLIFASTMEVYGWQPESDLIRNGDVPAPLPVFDENTIPNPNAPYAVAKYACEKYLEYANRSHGLNYVILRQSNSYGRKDNDFFVTEQIVHQMLRDPDRCNLGYRTPYRNFIYIDDLIDAWVTVIDHFDVVANNVFTVGPPNAISIEQHANNIAQAVGWNGTIKWDTRPSRPGEIYILNSGHQKLQSLTGWTPKVSYQQGISHTVELWRQKLSS